MTYADKVLLGQLAARLSCIAVCDECADYLTPADVETETNLCADCLARELQEDYEAQIAEDRMRDRANGFDR